MARKEFYFHVYFHEIFGGAGKTTETVIDPKGESPNFGECSAFDVPLWDSLNEKVLIGRAQGSSLQCDQTTLGWHLNFDIVFEIPELKGSTLQVIGKALQLTTPREFSVVGGTGLFTMAQGVIYGRRLSSPDESLWIELKVHGYYTLLEKPSWSHN